MERKEITPRVESEMTPSTEACVGGGVGRTDELPKHQAPGAYMSHTLGNVGEWEEIKCQR